MTNIGPASDSRFGSEGGVQRQTMLQSELDRYPKATLANVLAAANAGATEDSRMGIFWPTLKAMLERWATDAGLKLSYRLGSDFTLYKPVARIRTTDLQAAASELTTIYAAQGVFVTADSKQILVQAASDGRVDPTPTNDRGTHCQTGPC